MELKYFILELTRKLIFLCQDKYITTEYPVLCTCTSACTECRYRLINWSIYIPHLYWKRRHLDLDRTIVNLNRQRKLPQQFLRKNEIFYSWNGRWIYIFSILSHIFRDSHIGQDLLWVEKWYGTWCGNNRIISGYFEYYRSAMVWILYTLMTSPERITGAREALISGSLTTFSVSNLHYDNYILWISPYIYFFLI